MEEERDEDGINPEDITQLFEHEEKTIHPYKYLVELIYLDSEENKKEVKIRALVDFDVNKRLIKLFD